MKNYYTVLGLAHNSTVEQVRTRFRELARLQHPDRFQGAQKERAEREFQDLTEAFNVLSDAERRRLHDVELARPQVKSQAADPGQLAKVYLQRGSKAYREGNYFEAAESFDRASKAQPDNAKAWHHLALACSHQRRWISRATSAIAKACDLEPMNASYLKLAGRIFESADMPLKAEQFYGEALKWGGADPAVDERLEELRKRAKRGLGGLFGKVG